MFNNAVPAGLYGQGQITYTPAPHLAAWERQVPGWLITARDEQNPDISYSGSGETFPDDCVNSPRNGRP